jgi:hypothetical protein
MQSKPQLQATQTERRRGRLNAAYAVVTGAATLALLFGVGSAQAAGPPSYARDIPIPPRVQIGTGSLSAKCYVEMGGVRSSSATAQVLASGALPTIVRPGQSLWVTSVRARTTLPASVSDQLYQLGVRKLKVKLLESNEYLRDGANSTTNLAKDNNIQIPTITLVKGKPIVVSLGFGHALRLGPLATQGPGVAHLAVGETETQATAETASGVPLATLETVCPQPNPPELIATVHVAGKPAHNQVSVGDDYPARMVPPNSLVGSTGFEYRCRIPGAGAFNIPGSGTQYGMFGPGGLIFGTGRKIIFKYTQGDATLNPHQVARLIKLIHKRRGGRRATRVRYILEHTHVTAVHMLPAKASLNSSPVSGNVARLRPGRSLRLTMPETGTTLKPFVLTAGAPGIADEWLSDQVFRLQPLTTRGKRVGKPIQATCPTPHPLVPVFPAVIEAASAS